MSKSGRSKIDKNRPFVVRGPKAEKGPKTTARVVYWGEGRDPGEGLGGGEIPPQVGKEGFRTEGVSKPPQPRGLVGLWV